MIKAALYLVLGGVLLISATHLFLAHFHLWEHEVADSSQSISPANRDELLRFNATLIKLNAELMQLKAKATRHKPTVPAIVPPPRPAQRHSAMIFTMDCIQSYETSSKTGGAAGELIIRSALEKAFAHYQVPLRIVRSDDEFSRTDMKQFTILLLDPWTWAAKGWVPKRQLLGHEHKVFILDFFGSSKLRGAGMHVPPSRFLTAYPTRWNSFLGYSIDHDQWMAAQGPEDKLQGVIWGKDPKHLAEATALLRGLAEKGVHLVSTSSSPLPGLNHPNIVWAGHQRAEEWLRLLGKSRFLLGLGNPLLGPSAIDAVSLGCLFINPVYSEPMLEARYQSQHPFAATVAPGQVCEYPSNDLAGAWKCVQKALSGDRRMPAVIPPPMETKAYLARVDGIFNLSNSHG